MKTKEENIDYKAALNNKKVPILTLDEKWHSLFPEHEKTPIIKSLEKELNSLMKNQGKMVNEIKDLKVLKKRLMDEIISNMSDGNGAVNNSKIKKQTKNQEMIMEINDKMRDEEEELLDIPYRIREVNEKLLVESMKICYEKLQKNTSEIEGIGLWINKTRNELKDKLLVKQDMEMQNSQIYSYMHDLLGPEVVEIFDKNLTLTQTKNKK